MVCHVADIREATAHESASWQDEWRARLASWYGREDVPAEWVSQLVARRMATPEPTAASGRFAVTEGDQVIGMLAVFAFDQNGRRNVVINDIWIAEQHRRNSHGADALRHAETWAKTQDAAAILAVTDPADPAHAALFAGYPVRSCQMIKNVETPGQLAEGVESRAMTEDEFADWRAGEVRGYAADIADSGTLPPEEAAISAASQFDQLLPDGLNTAGHTFLCLTAGGEVVATNWIGHHYGPGVSWVYGVQVYEQHRGKGYGRAAMVAGEQAAVGAGDTHLALNVFGHNEVAIRLYESMGYVAYDHGRSIDL